MRLEFKFREATPPDRREDVVKQVRELGAASVEPLFPGDSDKELASLYKAEGVPDDATDVVSKIDSLDEVEFAERTPERKLIR